MQNAIELFGPEAVERADRHEEYLEEKRSSPLIEGLPKYQHIVRLGHKEAEGLLDGDVVVQEKLDGANATVAFVNGKLVVASRNQAISVDGVPNAGFRGLVQYVLAHPGIIDLAREYTLRGEWLVQHSLPYGKDALGHFYVFDVQSDAGAYITPDVYDTLLAERNIRTIPSIVLTRPSFDRLVDEVKKPSQFGAEHREGIVLKRYGFKNMYGRTQWGKMIHEDFKVKNSVSFGATRTDPAEVRIVGDLITRHSVLKTIHKVATARQEDANVKHMAEVLGRCYDDLVREELPDFLLKTKGALTIDFQSLRKLATTKARDIALAHYNGFPTVFEEETRDYLAPVVPQLQGQ